MLSVVLCRCGKEHRLRVLECVHSMRFTIKIKKGKVKGKVRPRTGREGPEGE